MTEQDESIASLERSGLKAALEWAAPIAFQRTGDDFDDDAGHDQMIVGVHNFVYLRDLLDRATANGRYALDIDASNGGTDMLSLGIPSAAFAVMPNIPLGVVARKDYKQSPGWAADGYRVLLSSYKVGGVDRINWSSRSAAKKDVASQHYVGGLTLFADEDFGLESLPGIPDDDDFNGLTLVAAHAYDPITGQFELFVGQSKNPSYRGDPCWHWRTALLLGGGVDGGAAFEPVAPVADDPDAGAADEIDVKLRSHPHKEQAGDANA